MGRTSLRLLARRLLNDPCWLLAGKKAQMPDARGGGGVSGSDWQKISLSTDVGKKPLLWFLANFCSKRRFQAGIFPVYSPWCISFQETHVVAERRCSALFFIFPHLSPTNSLSGFIFFQNKNVHFGTIFPLATGVFFNPDPPTPPSLGGSSQPTPFFQATAPEWGCGPPFQGVEQ